MTLLPDRLRRYLQDSKTWSIQRLSQETGISANAISDFINGKASMKYDRLCRIAEALDINLTIP